MQLSGAMWNNLAEPCFTCRPDVDCKSFCKKSTWYDVFGCILPKGIITHWEVAEQYRLSLQTLLKGFQTVAALISHPYRNIQTIFNNCWDSFQEFQQLLEPFLTIFNKCQTNPNNLNNCWNNSKQIKTIVKTIANNLKQLLKQLRTI